MEERHEGHFRRFCPGEDAGNPEEIGAPAATLRSVAAEAPPVSLRKEVCTSRFLVGEVAAVQEQFPAGRAVIPVIGEMRIDQGVAVGRGFADGDVVLLRVAHARPARRASVSLSQRRLRAEARRRDARQVAAVVAASCADAYRRTRAGPGVRRRRRTAWTVRFALDAAEGASACVHCRIGRSSSIERRCRRDR